MVNSGHDSNKHVYPILVDNTGKQYIIPSGDMARLAHYDRNLDVTNNYWGNSGNASHGWTVRWSYTVPANHIYNNGVFYTMLSVPVATAGRYMVIRIEVSTDAGVSYDTYCLLSHESTTQIRFVQTITAIFNLKAGDILKADSYHNDTVDHGEYVGALGGEFDE